MSDVQNTTTAQPAEAVVEKVMTNPTPAAPAEETTATEAPATTESAVEAPKTEETAAPATTEEKAEEKTDAATPATETKVAEPILEGQLGYKAPGLLKQFTFSKKEFWLNDAAVTPQNLGLFLRGEKSEVSHPITAWASQTGKGLLFFNKKGESDRTQPAGVIALYDATDLKKAAPHEFTFDISGHKHSFKATSDAERDGWYQSIEKAIELGKASKESVRDSEGYKAELEKLNTPTAAAGAVGAAKTRSQSQPKKSIDADQAEAKRAGSSDGEEDEAKKANKSRSTSRGMFNRLKGKKEEADVKKEEKKEEKEAVKEEKAAEKEEKKAEETTPVAAAATTSETPAETTTAEPAAATSAPAEEKPIEALPAAETKPEEKTKTNKRSSIFGKIPGAWSLKSPNKEKSEKEAELKPEVPAKDAAVSDAPPQLPETAATEPIETPVAGESTKPEITETAPEAKAAETATPNKEKKNFLSGLSFMNKRDRSVSPSAATKEQPTKTETAPAVPAKDETPVAEPVKADEPTTEAAIPATTETADKPAEKVEEPKSADATSPNGNKRTSMLGSLGRRASKALNRMQAPKKENAAPAAEKTAEEPAVEKKPEETTSTEPAATTATAPETIAERATETPAVASTEENKPENVVNQPTPVAASA